MTHTLKQQKLTLIGFGSQGQAWAKNLRESGYELEVFLREGSPSVDCVLKNQFPLTKTLSESKVILLLIPDQAHKDFYKSYGNQLKKNTIIIYAHGASLCEHNWQNLFPNLQHVLLAPKAIASELRAQYQSNGKLGAVFSIEFSNNNQLLKAEILTLAKDLGITAGPFEVTFKQETHADLLSEQSLLCGLIPYAAKRCFDFLVENGIPSELAYMEAWHEVKLIGNAMDKLGPEKFFNLISPHAFSGALKAKDKILPSTFDKALNELFSDIQSGRFFEESNKDDLTKTKEDEKTLWKNSKLQQTYENLKSDLT